MSFCPACTEFKNARKRQSYKEANSSKPVKEQAPLASMLLERKDTALRQFAQERKQLKSENLLLKQQVDELQQQFREAIQTNGVQVPNNLHLDIRALMDKSNLPEFMKLFWEEQARLFYIDSINLHSSKIKI